MINLLIEPSGFKATQTDEPTGVIKAHSHCMIFQLQLLFTSCGLHKGWWYCCNCTMWTIALNPVQSFSCNKKSCSRNLRVWTGLKLYQWGVYFRYFYTFLKGSWYHLQFCSQNKINFCFFYHNRRHKQQYTHNLDGLPNLCAQINY